MADHTQSPPNPLQDEHPLQQGRELTTAQGVRVPDTTHSLKAGRRGPTLLQDIHLREKITHFDHERIPERAVHARGAGAHGIFESYGTAEKLTRAGFLAKGASCRVFVRFSTVAGSRGSSDTPRDTRGFAVKFYTEEGVYDFVGNNIPVFFIQDAIKFPDIVHSVKPEADLEIPQAASAHNTFWDFVSLHTEAQHHTMWNMSDRALPLNYRTMEGFGVHTFRLVNADDETVLVKLHWKPKAGVHSTLWNEAQLLSGQDPDSQRRDLAEAIESGAFPQYELGLQVFPDTEDETFEGIDLLDPTKFVPEELAPVQPVGLLTLNANPQNYFSETEQVAFCPSHLVQGIDFTHDPLLQGRLFSYLDTQLSRLGGPNFTQLPINRPVAPVNDNHRDGMHQTQVFAGKMPAEPTSMDDYAGRPPVTGVSAPAEGGKGQSSGGAAAVDDPVYASAGVRNPIVQSELARPVAGTHVRGHAVSFDDHFSQPRMFYRSLTELEQQHIIDAYSFELGKCTVEEIRQRQLTNLALIDTDLCEAVAENLGMPAPSAPEGIEVKDLPLSPALSQIGGRWPVDGRTVAIIVDEGSDTAGVEAAAKAIEAQKMSVLVVAPTLGTIGSRKVDRNELTVASTEWDGVLVAAGTAPGQLPASIDDALTQAFDHGKAFATWGDGKDVLADLGIEAGPGILEAADGAAAVEALAGALAEHRVWERLAQM